MAIRPVFAMLPVLGAAPCGRRNHDGTPKIIYFRPGFPAVLLIRPQAKLC
jgi:hypothetical protein